MDREEGEECSAYFNQSRKSFHFELKMNITLAILTGV